MSLECDITAIALDMKAWGYLNKLKSRLAVLRDKYGVDICRCTWQSLDAHGEDMETCEMPGEDPGYSDKYCLRCGGEIES